MRSISIAAFLLIFNGALTAPAGSLLRSESSYLPNSSKKIPVGKRIRYNRVVEEIPLVHDYSDTNWDKYRDQSKSQGNLLTTHDKVAFDKYMNAPYDGVEPLPYSLLQYVDEFPVLEGSNTKGTLDPIASLLRTNHRGKLHIPRTYGQSQYSADKLSSILETVDSDAPTLKTAHFSSDVNSYAIDLTADGNRAKSAARVIPSSYPINTVSNGIRPFLSDEELYNEEDVTIEQALSDDPYPGISYDTDVDEYEDGRVDSRPSVPSTKIALLHLPQVVKGLSDGMVELDPYFNEQTEELMYATHLLSGLTYYETPKYPEPFTL